MVTAEKLKCPIKSQVCLVLVVISSFGSCLNIEVNSIQSSNAAAEVVRNGLEGGGISKSNEAAIKKNRLFLSAKPDNTKCRDGCALSAQSSRILRSSVTNEQEIVKNTQFAKSTFSNENLNNLAKDKLKRECDQCTPKDCLPPCCKKGGCQPKCQNTCPPLMNTPCPCPCPPKPCCPSLGDNPLAGQAGLVDTTNVSDPAQPNSNLNTLNFLEVKPLNSKNNLAPGNNLLVKEVQRVAKQCDCNCSCPIEPRCSTPQCGSCRGTCTTTKKNMCANKCPPTLPPCRSTCCPTTAKTTCPTTTCPPTCPACLPPCPKVVEPVLDAVKLSSESLKAPANSALLAEKNMVGHFFSERKSDVKRFESDDLNRDREKRGKCCPLKCECPTCTPVKPPCPKPCPPKCPTCCPTTCWAELPKPESKRHAKVKRDEICPCPWPCPCGTPGPCGKLDRCPGPYGKLPQACPKGCPPSKCTTPCPTTCAEKATTTCNPNCPTCRQYHKCKVGKRQGGEPKVAKCPKTGGCPTKCPTPCPCKPKEPGTTCKYPCSVDCNAERFVRQCGGDPKDQKDCFTTPACPCPSKCSTCPTTRGPSTCRTCPTKPTTCSPPNTCSTCRMKPCCPCSTYAVKRCVNSVTEGFREVRGIQGLLPSDDSLINPTNKTAQGKLETLISRNGLFEFEKEKLQGGKNKISEISSNLLNDASIHGENVEKSMLQENKKYVRQCCSTTEACTTSCTKKTKCTTKCTTPCPTKKKCTTKCTTPCGSKREAVYPKLKEDKSEKAAQSQESINDHMQTWLKRCCGKATTCPTPKTTCAPKCTTPCPPKECDNPCPPEPPKTCKPSKCCPGYKDDPQLPEVRAVKRGCCAPPGPAHCQVTTTKRCGTTPSRCPTSLKCPDSPTCSTAACGATTSKACCLMEEKNDEKRAAKKLSENSGVDKRPILRPPNSNSLLSDEKAKRAVCDIDKVAPTPCCKPTTATCPPKQVGEKQWSKRYATATESMPVENKGDSNLENQSLILGKPVKCTTKDPCADPCATTKDPCATTKDPCADPCATTKDPCADPCATTKDPCADPCATTKDPCATTKDPCADPCATTKDPCATTKDPCATTKDPCADPCATTKDPCAKCRKRRAAMSHQKLGRVPFPLNEKNSRSI